ncbi:unnamed protein product [Staurois parvus]|uniref:Uncharacterized protein n=1 Tax=Staurois parvus TaxID=386267 RepID=A0ABN9F433_9NEOB|nr:unnamed protein product [Staurois parvus]
MISVAPAAVPPASAHRCLSNATSVHINATYQCPSELPFTGSYQYQLVAPISAHQ